VVAVAAEGPRDTALVCSLLPGNAPALGPSLGHGVGMPMGYLPFAALAAIHLGGPQCVTARLTVDGGRAVLKAGGI
jgi:hypothetical protein